MPRQIEIYVRQTMESFPYFSSCLAHNGRAVEDYAQSMGLDKIEKKENG